MARRKATITSEEIRQLGIFLNDEGKDNPKKVKEWFEGTEKTKRGRLFKQLFIKNGFFKKKKVEVTKRMQVAALSTLNPKDLNTYFKYLVTDTSFQSSRDTIYKIFNALTPEKQKAAFTSVLSATKEYKLRSKLRSKDKTLLDLYKRLKRDEDKEHFFKSTFEGLFHDYNKSRKLFEELLPEQYREQFKYYYEKREESPDSKPPVRKRPRRHVVGTCII